MAWQPGVSGNVLGRPRMTEEAREARDLARKHTAAAISRLAELMRSTDETIAIAAAEAILNRGWGRAPQAIAIDASINGNATPQYTLIEAGMTGQQAAEAYSKMIEHTR